MRERDKDTGRGGAVSKRGERSKVSLYSVFRASHRAKDGRVSRSAADDGSSTISRYAKARWHGEPEEVIREQIRDDIANLLATVHLEAVDPLDDLPQMRRSVLNYGFIDLSSISSARSNSNYVANAVRQALSDHEPRLVGSSLDIRLNDDAKSEDHRISLVFSGEMQADPVDIAVEFEAHVDVAAGRMDLTDAKGGT